MIIDDETRCVLAVPAHSDMNRAGRNSEVARRRAQMATRNSRHKKADTQDPKMGHSRVDRTDRGRVERSSRRPDTPRILCRASIDDNGERERQYLARTLSYSANESPSIGRFTNGLPTIRRSSGELAA